MQEFFESTTGQIAVILVIVLIMALIMLSGKSEAEKKGKTDIKALTLSAVLIAIAMVLAQIRLFTMPQGGSVTLLSMLPIALCAYLLGPRRGIMAGIALGLVNLIFGPYVIHPVQLLLDYPLAFGAMGIGGLFRNGKNGLTKTYLVGILGRYICAFISGVVFFGAYAPEGFNAVTWSLWYNLTYIVAEGAITVVLINIPALKKAFASMKRQLEGGSAQ